MVKEFNGSNFLRQRLILSTLSGIAIRITKIRANDLESPGLKNYEASLLRLLDTLTNGTIIEVNESGTILYYQPGSLIGGKFTHECSNERAIGYYLEILLALAPFCKQNTEVILSGITNDRIDASTDLLKRAAFPILKLFLGSDDGIDISILKRGVAPEGQGRVLFKCPCKTKLRPVQIESQEKIKRIRGVAWTCRVSPIFANRAIESCRSILNQFLPDIYIQTDHSKGELTGPSPGFGLTLYAETTNGVLFCGESCSFPRGGVPEGETPSVPETVGIDAANNLLREIFSGGCVDRAVQFLPLLFMTLEQKDVSKYVLGQVTPYAIQFLRHLKEFFNMIFQIEDIEIEKVADINDDESDDDNDDENLNLDNDNDKRRKGSRHKRVKVSDEESSGDERELKMGGPKFKFTCVGVGFSNLNKAIR